MRFSEVLLQLRTAIGMLPKESIAIVVQAFKDIYAEWSKWRSAVPAGTPYPAFDVAQFVMKLPPELAGIGAQVRASAQMEVGKRGPEWAQEHLGAAFVTYVFNKQPGKAGTYIAPPPRPVPMVIPAAPAIPLADSFASFD